MKFTQQTTMRTTLRANSNSTTSKTTSHGHQTFWRAALQAKVQKWIVFKINNKREQLGNQKKNYHTRDQAQRQLVDQNCWNMCTGFFRNQCLHSPPQLRDSQNWGESCHPGTMQRRRHSTHMDIKHHQKMMWNPRLINKQNYNPTIHVRKNKRGTTSIFLDNISFV